MTKNISFYTKKRFLGEKDFSHGISRSGEFTSIQAKLLEEHGDAYEKLCSGEREPINAEEREFLKVFKGKKEAESPHEKAWYVYCQKTNKPRVQYSLGPSNLSQIRAEPVLEDD